MNDIDLTSYGSVGWIFSLTKQSSWGNIREFYFNMKEDIIHTSGDEIILESEVWGTIQPSQRIPSIGDGIAFYHSTNAEYPAKDFHDRKRRISLIGVIEDIQINKNQVNKLKIKTNIQLLKILKAVPLLRDDSTESIFSETIIANGPIYTFYSVSEQNWVKLKDLIQKQSNFENITFQLINIKSRLTSIKKLDATLNAAENLSILGEKATADALYSKIIENSTDSDLINVEYSLIFSSILNFTNSPLTESLVNRFIEKIEQGYYAKNDRKICGLIGQVIKSGQPNFTKDLIDLISNEIKYKDDSFEFEIIKNALNYLIEKDNDLGCKILNEFLQILIIDNVNSDNLSEVIGLKPFFYCIDDKFKEEIYSYYKNQNLDLDDIIDVELYLNPLESEVIKNLNNIKIKLESNGEKSNFPNLLINKDLKVLLNIEGDITPILDVERLSTDYFRMFIRFNEFLHLRKDNVNRKSIIDKSIQNIEKNIDWNKGWRIIYGLINYFDIEFDEGDDYSLKEWIFDNSDLIEAVCSNIKLINSDLSLQRLSSKLLIIYEHLYSELLNDSKNAQDLKNRLTYIVKTGEVYLSIWNRLQIRLTEMQFSIKIKADYSEINQLMKKAEDQLKRLVKKENRLIEEQAKK